MGESDVLRGTLQGWKSIAAYFRRDERTVMRWAKERGLPVRRLPGEGRSTVYARTEDLAAWLSRGGPEDAIQPQAAPEPAAELVTTKPAPAPAQPIVSPVPMRSARLTRPSATAFLAILLLLLVGGAAIWWALRPQIVAAEPPTSPDPASERAYIQASYDLENRTPESLNRAIAEFGTAIAADPRNAKAYAGLGQTYLLLPEYSTVPADRAYARAKAAADASIALQPDIAAAHRVRAYVLFWADRDVAAAQREFATALRLAPDDPVTHHWYATALSANGEGDRSVAEINRALALDPQSTSTMADSGLLLFVAGDHAEGLRRLRMVERARPDQISAHQYLAGLSLTTGDDRTFLAEQAIANRLRGDPAADRLLAAARQGYAAGGHKGLLAALDAAMAETVKRTGQGYYDLARIAALEGNAARASSLLQTSFDHHEPATVGARGQVSFQPLVASGRLQIPGEQVPL